MKRTIINIKTALLAGFLLSQAACNKFLEIDTPDSIIVSDAVFSDDITATSVMTGIYNNLISRAYPYTFAGGGPNSITMVSGFSSDDFMNFNRSDEFLQFEQNELTSRNSMIVNLWASMYASIYETNEVLEGVAASTGMTDSAKSHLRGEALFIRSFTYFYLTQLFGDVPFIETTDYTINQSASKTKTDQILKLLERDLLLAQSLLPEAYPWKEPDGITVSRARVNKAAATGLLARVYLFMKEWGKAATEASKIIAGQGRYALTDDLHQAFAPNSMETIWQLKPIEGMLNTSEGAVFLVLIGSARYVELSPGLYSAFENGDKRKEHWVLVSDLDGTNTYSPYKYKVRQGTVLSEYSMVMRLAEQYLIRAEARIENGDIAGGIGDLNELRSYRRSAAPGALPDLPLSMAKEAALAAVRQERRVELFSEWGHRWLDLKRWGLAREVLAPLKPTWDDHDVLYPIPLEELDKNAHLKPQNAGY